MEHRGNKNDFVELSRGIKKNLFMSLLSLAELTQLRTMVYTFTSHSSTRLETEVTIRWATERGKSSMSPHV